MATEFTLADLSLFPATAEQTRESRKRHAVQWARGQSLEEYLLRDEVMEADEHATNGKFITWVLAPRNDPTTLDFMSSCETFRRAALVARPTRRASPGGATADTEAQQPEVEETTAYAIASVYTPAPKRKKGYAQHLMRLLHWVLAPCTVPALPRTFPPEWGAPPDTATLAALAALGVANAGFSVLYSDVGRAFYRACGPEPLSLSPGGVGNGWHVVGAQSTFWNLCDPNSEPEAEAEAFAEKKLDRGEGAVPSLRIARLSEPDLAALYDHDARWMRDDLVRDRETRPGRTQFTFLPNGGVGVFVVRRTMDFTPEPDLRPVLPSAQWGAVILPDGAQSLADAVARQSSDPVSFVTWTLDLRTSPRTLVVARLRADEDTLPVLLDELLAVAREEKVDKVEFWYMRPELRALAESKGWKTQERTEHLPAVKWYGPEKEEELDWVYNEKFCWC